MSEPETIKLYQYLREHNLKSIGPQTSIHLMGIAEEAAILAASASDPDVKKALIGYVGAITIVCRFSAVHQKAVIDTLKDMVSDAKGQ